jgi:hypothetical protein
MKRLFLAIAVVSLAVALTPVSALAARQPSPAAKPVKHDMSHPEKVNYPCPGMSHSGVGLTPSLTALPRSYRANRPRAYRPRPTAQPECARTGSLISSPTMAQINGLPVALVQRAQTLIHRSHIIGVLLRQARPNGQVSIGLSELHFPV